MSFHETPRIAIALKTVMPSPCIAVAFKDATVILLAELKFWRPVNAPAGSFWQRAYRYWRFVPAGKPMPIGITQAPQEDKDIWMWGPGLPPAERPHSPDCFTVDGSKLIGVGMARVMDELERGAAAVREHKTGQFVPQIFISRFGVTSGPVRFGDIAAYLPDADRPFLVANEWVI